VIRLLTVIAAITLLGACTALREPDAAKQRLIKAPADSEEAVLVARSYASRGRWRSARRVIDEALAAGHEPAPLESERAALAAQFADWEQLLEDRITVGDAENQQAKITLLEQLSRASPDDLLLASRRLYWKEVLRGRAPALTECAERHVATEPLLAKRCYRLVVDMVEDEALEKRLVVVREQIKEGEQLAEERRRLRAEKARQGRAKELLEEARTAIDASDYRGALDILAEVEGLQPDNPEIEGLAQTAWSMLSPQVEALVKLGDHLYLDEQLDAAIATWQAALNLKPNDEEILARITRARTVLKRLDDLRHRQRASPAEAS
jgi:tetratricopeptide (TPR) repeat protein